MVLFVFFIVGLCASSINAVGYYRVVGPRVLRPNSDYHVAVSVQATSVPTSVRLEVVGRQDNGRVYSVDQSLVVEPYSTRVARLQIADISKGDFRLVARGSGGVSFETSTPLTYVEKSYSVFIQTDKYVYKPGHKILFRALVLNSQLKPAAEVRNEPLKIQISDGKGNVVKQWAGVTATRGVFSGELMLSESPVLGDWNISVTIHRQTFNKMIQVAQYVLPKFLIDIQTKKHVKFSENTIFTTIQSRYNYGKKVKGDATITMYPTIYSGVIQPIFQNPIRKVIPLDGMASVEFDIGKDLRLSDEYERTVIVDVTVEEALTGRRQNNSIEVHIHKYEYKMEMIKTADYYKPGLKYTAFIKVSNHDGSPIKEDMRKVTVRHGYSKVNEIYQEEIYKLNKNGIAELTFYPPKEASNETALRIEAEYMDLKEWFSPIPAAISRSKNYLLAELLTDRPIVNQDIEILVNCTEPLKYISYELLGRGDVILANTLNVRNDNEYKFHFTASHAMVPSTHLIVNYVRSDGELVADSLDIEIDGLLQNYIDIQLNSVETRPDVDIDLTIRAQPNSYIGLLAVDQNAGLLKSGYDLSQDMVSNDLRSYDIAEASPFASIFADKRKHFVWKSGSSNAKDIFYSSGSVMLTNSFVNSFRPTLEDIYLRPVYFGSSQVKPDRGPAFSIQTVTRPPLAGPYAFSRIPRPVWNKPKVYLPNNIEDTWLFSNFSSGFEGKTSIRKRIPNTLNTWVITGFSLDPLHGLGLVNTPRKLKVSKSFVVSLDLPNHIQRGEMLAIPIVVYNHQDKDITAEVTLHNVENRFQFAIMPSMDNDTTKIELFRKKSVNVKRNSGASVSFIIKPTILGFTEIKVTASGSSQTDTVQKQLFVKAEGETLYYSKNMLIDLRKTSSFKGNLSIEIPQNVVPNSENIEVSVVGDLLGPTIINLDSLIKIPTGCGEQNMLHFIPNVIVLNYLKNTNQLTPSIQQEAVDNLETHYQQQLAFRNMNGSFSTFGKADSNGSVWLTAFVTQALKQAQDFIYMDDNVILDGLQWLSEMQAPNGSFPESGTIIHHKLQNLNGNSIALTSFVAITFYENKKLSPSFTNIVKRAMDYVSRYLDEDEDTYAVTLANYALHLTDHPSKRIAFNILESKAKTNNTKKWWGEDYPKNEEKNPWNHLPKSIDIEMTSYALLTYVEAGLLEDATPVLNWLILQENGFGGFASTQDTVVALHSLSKLTKKLAPFTNMQVKFSYRRQESSTVSINKDNSMIVQKYQISSTARQMNVTAEGSGLALLRITYKYNMNVTGPWPMFTLDPQVDKNSNMHHLQLSICTAFVSRNLSEVPTSNMAVMEVNLPSGFTADKDSLPSLEVSQNVKLVETKNGDTTVVLYFDKIIREEYCPTVRAFRTHKVANQKPVPVIIYDYYDTSRRSRVFYRGPSSRLRDICEAEDCDTVDILDPETQVAADTENEKGKASSLTQNWLLILVLVYVLRIYH